MSVYIDIDMYQVPSQVQSVNPTKHFPFAPFPVQPCSHPDPPADRGSVADGAESALSCRR